MRERAVRWSISRLGCLSTRTEQVHLQDSIRYLRYCKQMDLLDLLAMHVGCWDACICSGGHKPAVVALRTAS